MKQPYNTALYMRLSRDDETFGDSVSIETQRNILRAYAKENALHVVDEYVDDGWSGTNFDRPDFQRMMDDVEAGKINCIVTKDLSRFGREHVMMDYYLEFMFPEKHVRYIAVSDNEDTEKGLSDFVPFKNLFNEWFAKDTSRKVKAALKAKRDNGEHICTYAPLGYRKNPEQKNCLIIDEETRWIVEKVFDLAAHGAGAAKITNILREEKVPTPGWINYQRSGAFSHIYEGNRPERAYAWTINPVKRMLSDETYIGNTVYNKSGSISYKNKKQIRKPAEQWVRIENTHEPIISKEQFELVQQQINSRRRPRKESEPQIFSGLVRCADCGWTMSFGRNTTAKKPYQYFVCTAYRMYSKNKECTSHYIRYDILYQYVLARIQYWAKQVQANEEKLLDHLQKAGENEYTVSVKKQTTELKKTEKRKSDVDRAFAKMYEDWVEGRITEYNFQMLSQKYQAEQEELDKKIQTLQIELMKKQKSTEDAVKWIELIKKIGYPKELTAELLNTLIEKILIHETEKSVTGIHDQEIEIVYRFVGKIE